VEPGLGHIHSDRHAWIDGDSDPCLEAIGRRAAAGIGIATAIDQMTWASRH